MKRREFLLGSFVSVVWVACGSAEDGAVIAGEGSPKPDSEGKSPPTPSPTSSTQPPAVAPTTPTSAPDASDKLYPQGIASGDPRSDRVLLWTRIEPTQVGKSTDTFDLMFLIAEDEALTKIVGKGTVPALPDADHTVRIMATGLKPGAVYYYRFESGGITTRVGRTKTAPDASANVGVKFALASCQDFIGRYWHAWQSLVDDKPDLDFVLFLGDYIYETVDDPTAQAMITPDRVINLPDGFDSSKKQDGTRIAAKTLADYRTLYKAYRSDPVLREMHRLYPFIVTWDDHEFSNDCWGDHSTSFAELDPVTKTFTTEQDTPRRVAASRAFFEFQAADVAYSAQAAFPNDIKIYRKLRYGKHLELFMTDERMYRADHLIPEGPVDLLVGKFQANAELGARQFVRKSGFDSREAAAKPTMLGAIQKGWFIDAVTNSTATWKFWGNEVQVYQMALRLNEVPGIPAALAYTAYVNCDQWDGYRSERAEILGAFATAGVENFVVCTGDIHSFFAAELHVDFDHPKAKPVAVEFVCAGISSANLGAVVADQLPGGSLLGAVGNLFAAGADIALKATNPHLRYADTMSNGYSLVDLDGDRVEVTCVKVGDPTKKKASGVLSRQKLVTRKGTNRIEIA